MMSIGLFLLNVLLSLSVFYIIKTYIIKVSAPLLLLVGCFGWGILAGSFQGWLIPPANVEASLQALEAIVEPLLKVIALALLLWRRQITSYRLGIVYGLAVGLGFAFSDNWIYLNGIDSPMLADFGRVETVASVHAVSTGMMGFAMSMGRGRRTRLDKVSPIIGILIAALWQAAFNSLSGSVPEDRLILVSLIFIIGGMALMIMVIKTSQQRVEKLRADDLLDVVIPIGVELSSEKDFGRLLERMTVEAVKYCKADAGILYLRTDADTLKFVSVRHERQGIALGGTTQKPIPADPIPLQGEGGAETAAGYVALHNKPLNLGNVHHSSGYDFTNLGMGAYRPFSCLTLPLLSSQDSTIGVLQLFDARDPETDVIIPFEENLEDMMVSFSSLATAALEGYLREASMRQEYAQLTISIDGSKVQDEVQQIQESDFFKDLQARARELRRDKEAVDGR